LREAAEDSAINFSDPGDQDEEVQKRQYWPISQYYLRTVQSATATQSSAPPAAMMMKRHLVVDPLFVASLDRTNTTPRQAMHIVAPALKAAGVDADTVSLSTSTIHKARKTVHESLAMSQKKQFVPSTPLVAHFDGKLLPDSQSEELVDQMPIVVSGLKTEKPLAIPKLPISTGEIMGNAVVQTLQDWDGVPDWLAGLCFDTTSSNTGIHTCAITVIQRAFEKRLLFLACHHHILEIISAAVFDQFFKSSGPQIALFSRFKEQWKFIDVTQYAAIDVHVPGVKSYLTSAESLCLCQMKAEVISFLQNQISLETQPRQDYLEFVKLSLAMLGVAGDDINQPTKNLNKS